ncbi:MAG: Hsp70 family protein, partial [Okeania sp. SIO3B3]|nr:Hsp70 family protein [Okeania sp. SIO3B3]
LGGGTFDVSIVEINGSVSEVLASHGNNHLGGDDFDNKLAHWLSDRFLSNHEIDLFDDVISKRRLTSSAENAKIQLSEHIFVEINEEFIAKKGKKSLHLKEKITRDDLESLIEPFIDETMISIDKAIEDAKISISDIDRVILVGGSTKMPLVKQKLEEHLDQTIFDLVDPDLCVAIGAGYHAGVLAGEEIESILVDVTPFSLGVGTNRLTPYGIDTNYFSVIIPRNTVVPCSRSQIFTNPPNNPESLTIPIYQGEQEYIDGNIFLGAFEIEDLPL